MTRSGVEYRLGLAVKTAALNCHSLATKKVSPHTIRHTTAMHLLQSGVDLSVIAIWLVFSVKQNSRNSPHRLPGKRHGKFPAFAIGIFPVDCGNSDGCLLPSVVIPQPGQAIQVAAAV